MKKSIEKFKKDFAKSRSWEKALIMGGFLTMTFVSLLNLSYRLYI